jgi:hypothetical protein
MIERVDDTSQPIHPQHSILPRQRRRNTSGNKLQTRAPQASTPDAPTSQTSSGRKDLTVEFRSGEAVNRHPELISFINDGWQIESAVPELSNEGLKLVVVMSRLVSRSTIASVRTD